MARMLFGGGIADWVFSLADDSAALVEGGITITFWNQPTGGNQFTDLTSINGDPISQVTTSTGGADAAAGQIPQFFGPDGVFSVWAAANNGPRALMSATNIGEYFGPSRSLIETHLSGGNPNPHNTTLASLTDVANLSSGTTGQILGKLVNGTWGPITVAGVGGTVQLSGDQAITGTKTFESQSAPAAPRVVVNAAESQSSDVLQVWSSAEGGQGGVKQKTLAANSKGELRVIPSKSNTTAVRVGAQPGQTAHPFQQVNSNDAVLSWMEANGVWRAPNLGRSIMFSRAGAIAAGAGTFAWYNDTGVPLTVRSVRATVNVAPTGAAVLVDVNLSGVTVFTTQAGRPTIAAGAKTSGKVTAMNTTTVPDGGYITVDIDQVGSSVAGSDLTVQIDLY